MVKNNIVISNMSKDDLLLLKHSLTDEFDDFWTYSILEQEFNNEHTTYVVAKENDCIVGFAGLQIILDEATVMNIVTKKSERKMGIGTLLLESLIELSKQKTLASITLEVNEKNIPAIKLYEKLQFKQVGIRKKYYDNTDAAILMTLYL